MFGLKELYQYARFTAFNKEARDFVDMGLGIEARAKRCKKYWKKHLELSKQFIKNACEISKNSRSISILGAGRLYDFPLEVLNNFELVRLVDADPSCLPYWKKIDTNAQKIYDVKDITGIVNIWTNSLANFLTYSNNQNNKNLEVEISIFLNSLNIDDVLADNKITDVVVSLNLLSQIPIYWRDRFAKLLYSHTGIDSDANGKYSSIIQTSLENTFKLLQEQHLKLLAKTAINSVVLINDLNFNYYKKTHSNWITEPALYTESMLASEELALVKKEGWLWHISPEDVEQKGFGVIHEVEAKHYLKTVQ